MDKALRAAAEMENLKRRTLRDVEDAHKYALERFVSELLPVFDSLELGLSSSEQVAEVAASQGRFGTYLKDADFCL